MSREKLDTNLTQFYDEMEKRLEELSDIEKQQYLEGLVHAFDSVTRLCSPQDLTPFERENFIGSSKSWAYSKNTSLKT